MLLVCGTYGLRAQLRLRTRPRTASQRAGALRRLHNQTIQLHKHDLRQSPVQIWTSFSVSICLSLLIYKMYYLCILSHQRAPSSTNVGHSSSSQKGSLLQALCLPPPPQRKHYTAGIGNDVKFGHNMEVFYAEGSKHMSLTNVPSLTYSP